MLNENIFQCTDLDLRPENEIFAILDGSNYLKLDKKSTKTHEIAYNFIKNPEKTTYARQEIVQNLSQLALKSVNWTKITNEILSFITEKQKEFQKFSSATINLISGNIENLIKTINEDLDYLGLKLDGEGEIFLHYFSLLLSWKKLSCIYIK